MASVAKNLDRTIARLPGVKAAVRALGNEVGARARADLSTHRETGASKIEVRRVGPTDTIVSLVDEAAVSIEYGHHTKGGTYVEGLHIMTKAADL